MVEKLVEQGTLSHHCLWRTLERDCLETMCHEKCHFPSSVMAEGVFYNLLFSFLLGREALVAFGKFEIDFI